MKSLFINDKDVKTFTSINGNLDIDRYVNAVYLAQITHIQSMLGTDLYERLSTDIENDSLSGAYRSLLEDYIKPVLIHYSMVEMLPRIAYQISNKGIFKHRSENSETASADEIDDMIERERSAAQFHADRFLDYIRNNTTTFPEYLSNSSSDLHPDHTSYFTGFVLD
jgi:hypothetical protein